MTDVVVHLSSPASRHGRIAHGMRRLLDELPDAVLKDIGLARSDIPFVVGRLMSKRRNPARQRSIGSTGTQCGGTRRSSVCQKPSFASRLWQQPLFQLFSSFHPPSWLSGNGTAKVRFRKRCVGPWSNSTGHRQTGLTVPKGRGRSTAMPALAFLAMAGLVLIALLFVADAALEKDDSPVIATSQHSGLPESSPAF